MYGDAVHWFCGCSFFLLNWMFQHDCLDTYCFWVSYMHAFSIFVFAPVQRNWACFTWKSTLEIRSLLLLLLSKTSPDHHRWTACGRRWWKLDGSDGCLPHSPCGGRTPSNTHVAIATASCACHIQAAVTDTCSWNRQKWENLQMCFSFFWFFLCL